MLTNGANNAADEPQSGTERFPNTEARVRGVGQVWGFYLHSGEFATACRTEALTCSQQSTRRRLLIALGRASAVSERAIKKSGCVWQRLGEGTGKGAFSLSASRLRPSPRWWTDLTHQKIYTQQKLNQNQKALLYFLWDQMFFLFNWRCRLFFFSYSNKMTTLYSL